MLPAAVALMVPRVFGIGRETQQFPPFLDRGARKMAPIVLPEHLPRADDVDGSACVSIFIEEHVLPVLANRLILRPSASKSDVSMT